jgi:hypothetical protein
MLLPIQQVMVDDKVTAIGLRRDGLGREGNINAQYASGPDNYVSERPLQPCVT